MLKEDLSIYCAMQHFIWFYYQACQGGKADWGEPCAKCSHIEECKSDWFSRIQPLLEQAGIVIEQCSSRQPQIWGKSLDQGNCLTDDT